MKSIHFPGLVGLLCSSLSCTFTGLDYWDQGIWEEECFQTDNTCDWSPSITQPDSPFQYYVSTSVSIETEDTSGNYLDAELSLAENQADDFWNLCSISRDGVTFDCRLAIQLAHAPDGLIAHAESLCGSTDNSQLYSHTTGVLIRREEARMNHYMELSCADVDAANSAGVDDDTYREQLYGCRMNYTSILKKI